MSTQEHPPSSRKPKWRHRICARPLVICWIFGALMLWLPITMALWREGVFPAAFSFDVWTLLLLLVGYTCLGGLGFFAGVIPFCWLVARLCRWVNGGPYVPGDRVIILVGKYAGTSSTVYQLTRGQAGDLLPMVELGDEVRRKHLDIFDDFNLLRVSRRKTLPSGDLGHRLNDHLSTDH